MVKNNINLEEWKTFNQHHENKPDPAQKKDEAEIIRYNTPEKVIEDTKDYCSDIWVIGCIFVEMFSKENIWHGMKTEQIKSELKKQYVPKISSDVPHNSWSIICECLNPFWEARITARELLEKYVRLMFKLKIPQMAPHLEKYASLIGGEVSKLNNTIQDGEDVYAIRKCPLHPKYEAFMFCAQCCEIICDQCKYSIHAEHADRGVFFEYLDFINLARTRIHAYKEKFTKYLEDANVPNREIYDSFLQTNKDGIDKLYTNQHDKINQQFEYLTKIIGDLKEIELKHLEEFKEFFQMLFGKILDNYNALNEEIDSVKTLTEEKEKLLLQFQDMEQRKKEETMKSVPKDENLLNIKKRNIIRYVSNFHRESNQIDRLKRYFEVFIDKYKENKINDLVKVVEKKNTTIKNKYAEIDKDSYLKVLVYEFEQMSLLCSRNYFNTNARELFISIVNTNKIFSFNIDSNKYFITEVDFKDMPIEVFPNYSRSLVLNGNLLVNGGYDDKNKVTLPYFFFYDRLNKTLTRLNDMLFGHSAHSIIYIPPHFICIVSGSGTLKCEKYNMEDNTWQELPDISICRQNCTLFYYNKQYLYAFGGAYWNETNKGFVYIESVERLDLGFGSVEGASQWEQLQTYKFGEKTNLKKSVMAVISYTPNKILLIGGSISYNTYSDETIIFDFEKNEFNLKEGLLLPKKTCFPNKSFMYHGEKCFQLDNDGHVYEFDLVKDKFRIVKENTVMKKA